MNVAVVLFRIHFNIVFLCHFLFPCLTISVGFIRLSFSIRHCVAVANLCVFFLFLNPVEMTSNSFGGLGSVGTSMIGSSSGNINSSIGSMNFAQTYQAMMQNIQNLIKLNPEFLTKGIPNNLLHMCMEQTKMPPIYGVRFTIY